MQTLLVVLVLLSLSVSTSIAQVVFDPQFNIGDREVEEGGSLVVRLSAEAMTDRFLLTPSLDTSGYIEVDLILEQGTTEPFAQFGIDYFFCDNASSTISTVRFKVRQTNSTEVKICIFDDNTFENSEFFQLRILAVLFPPNLRPLFIPIPGFNSTSEPIEIKDNDFVNVRWKNDSLPACEGVNETVILCAVSEGVFARPISIGVACSPVRASDVSAAEETLDWTVSQTALVFSDIDSVSSTVCLTVTIVDDDIAEPRESFICNLQSGNADSVKAVPPTQVTISIIDKDELVISWEEDFYRFRESDLLANVSLVSTSNFTTSVRIPGFPIQIVNSITSVTVPGPIIPNFGSLPATINFITFRGIQYGVARVAGRTQFPDIVSSVNDFSFNETSKRDTRGFDIKDDAILENDELFMAEFDISSLIDEGWNAKVGNFPITYIAIDDDDSVEVNFKESSYRVNESAGQVQVTLMVTGQFFKVISATVECVEGNATDPEDWEEARQYRVQFRLTRTSDRIAPLGEAESEPIILNITNDAIYEGDEVFTCRIISTSDAATVRIGPRNEVPVTIVDDDRVVVRYEMDRYQVEEEAGYLEVALLLTGTSLHPVSVAVNTLFLLDSSVGAAATVVDFVSIDRQIITFEPGETRKAYNITIIDDVIPEDSEFFNLDVNVADSSDARFVTIGTPKQPLVEITDKDVAVNISLSARTYSIFENEARVVVTVTLTGAYPQDITVNVSLAEIGNVVPLERAIADVDFLTDGFPQDVTIPAGETSREFVILINDEGIVEKDEKFRVFFTYSDAQPGVLVTPGFDEAVVEIKNDDALHVEFDEELYRVREDASRVKINIIANSTASFDYEVNLALSDITAIFGVDYDDDTDFVSESGMDQPEVEPFVERTNITIIMGAGSDMAMSEVVIIDDEIYEGVESFHVNLSVSEFFQAQNILEGDPIVARVEIEDEDILSVRFDPANYEVNEGENKVLILLANRTFDVSFDINVSLFENTATVEDYDDRDYVVTFDVETQMGMLVVHANEDMILEDPEMFFARLSIPSGLERVVEGDPPEAKITIIDRTEAEVFFDPVMYPIDEGEKANLTLKLTKEVASGVTIVVQYVTQDGSAKDGEDYTGGIYNVTFVGSNMATVPVPSIDDDTLEGVENFTAVIRVPSNTQRDHMVTRGSPDTAIVEINDNDMLMVFFDRERYSVSEDDGVARITVRSTKPHTLRYTVIVTAADGSAAIDEDYRGNRFEVTFPVGSQSVTFNIPIVNDTVFEGPEFFNLSIVVPQEAADIGVEPGIPIDAFVDITDDEIVNVFFDPDMYNVTEGGVALITVRADREFTVPFSVIVTLQDGSAVAPGDYDSSQSPYTVTFQPGQPTQSISVPTNNDNIVEMTESFTAVLSNTDESRNLGVNVIDPDEATVNIFDNDPPIEVLIRQNYTVTEGDVVGIVVEVSSTDYEFDFTVTLNHMDGSAGAPGDYVPGPYQVSFSAGQPSATLSIQTENDNIAELSEYFKVMIVSTSKPDLVVIGDPDTSYVTIEDNDFITCSKAPENATVTEGGVAGLTVECSGQYEFDFTLFLDTMNGSAVAPGDYTSGGYSLSFTAGQQSSVLSVSTLDDTIAELEEYFKVMITGSNRPDKVIIGDPDTCFVTIQDNDAIEVLIRQNYTVTEGDVVGIVVEVSSTDYEFDFTVTLNHMDGSAGAPGDYVPGPYQVSFSAGQRSATLSIQTENDDIAELSEYFKVMIVSTSEPDRVDIGDPDTSYVAIEDNDSIEVLIRQNYTVTEGDEVGIVVEVSSTDYEFDFTVTLNHMNGSAGAPGDYVPGPYQVSFSAGQPSATLSIQTENDDIAELSEYFKVMIVSTSEPDRVAIGDPDTSYVTIEDNDAIQVLIRQNYTVTEGDVVGIVVEISTTDYEFDFTVTLNHMNGSAGAPGDYVPGPYQVSFSAGQPSATLSIQTENDDIAELSEYFKVMIVSTSEPDRVAIGDPDTSYVTIEDNDFITCSKAPENATVTEGGVAGLTVECSGTYDFDFTLLLDTMDGSAVAPGDYTSGGYSLSFTAGQQSSILSVSTLDDTIAELEEYFKVMITGSDRPDKVIIGDPDTCFVTIQDNDVVTCSKAPENATVTEGDLANITIVCSGEFDFDFTLFLDTMDGSAVAPGDYTSGGYSLSFTAGQTSGMLSVQTFDDSIAEPEEFFKVMITRSSRPGKVIIGDPDTCFVTIQDNDAIEVLIRQNYTVTEGGVVGIVVEVSSTDYEFDFTVTLNHMNGSAGAPGDYVPGPYQVSFSAGQPSATLSIQTENDDIAELSEYFKVMIVSISETDRVAIGDPDTSYVTIEDNDFITCSKAPENATVTEGGVAGLTVECSGQYDFDFTLFLDTMDGSAVAPGDYTSGGYSLSFNAGQTSSILSVSTSDDTIAELEEYFKVMITGSDRPDKVIIGDPDTCFVTIQDNDVVTCSKAPENATVTEGDLANITIVCSGEFDFDFTLFLDTMDGSAVAPGDYTSGGYSLSFTAGQTLGIISVQTLDDTIAEPEEFFKVMITRSDRPGKVTIGDPDTCFVSIRDNEGLSCFFQQPTYSVTEGDSVNVTIMTSTSAFSFPFTVTLRYMDGSAELSEDYTPSVFTVDFAPGQSSATFEVATVEDSQVEKLENFKIMKVGTSEPGLVSPGSPDMVTIEIEDDDVLTVMFDPDGYEVSEGEIANVILVTNLPYSFDFSVIVDCENGSAGAPGDFIGGQYTVNFTTSPNQPGMSSASIRTLPDNVFECEEYFKCTLIVPDMGMDNVVKGTPDMARVNITDNTGAVVFFDPDVYMEPEGSNATLTIRTTATVGNRFSVIVTSMDVSATSPADYEGGTKIAIFEVGSSTATVTFGTEDDEVKEGMESFRATLSVSEAMREKGVSVGSPDTAVVNIIDNDELFVMFERTVYTVTEGNPPDDVTVEVTLIATRECDDEYVVTIIASDVTAEEGDDYIGRSFMVTFPPGSTTASFNIPIVSDIIFEPDEIFSLRLEAPEEMDGQCRDVQLGMPDRANVTIVNDEPRITVGIEKTNYDVVENEGKVNVCLVKSGPSSLPIMAMLILEESDVQPSGSGIPQVNAASEIDDFDPMPVPEVLTIPANVTKMCFDVIIKDDPMVEKTEPFLISVVFPPNQPALQTGEITAAGNGNGTINILDDDNITVQFRRRMYMAFENENNFQVEVVASGNASFPYTFTVTVMDIEATQLVDYIFSTLPLTFEEGQLSAAFTLPIIDDNLVEGNETFKLLINVPQSTRDSGISEGEINMTVLLIKDNDVPTVTFDPQNHTVPEGSPANITVVLDKVPVTTCTVNVTTMDISATSPSDYNSVVQVLVFQPGESSITFSVDTIIDSTKEPNEHFKVVLTSDDENCVIGSPDESFVTIVDPTAITVRFEEEMYMAFESDGMVSVTILASSPALFSYNIIVTAMDIEAIRPDDYIFENTTVTFSPGETSKPLSIPIISDMLDELDETFKLTITIPEASRDNDVSEGSPIMTVVLIKDSDVPTVTFNPQNHTVPEGSPANITVVLDKVPVSTCTVNVTTMDISATSPSDYNSVVRVLVFQPGESSITFSVDTLIDSTKEPNEHFKVVLTSNDENCVIGSPDESFVTIVDPTAITVRFEEEMYMAFESDGMVSVTILASSPALFSYNIIVTAMDIEAIRPDDYIFENTTVTFSPGETSKPLSIPIISDMLDELDETFKLTITIPEASRDNDVSEGSPIMTVVLIKDSDVPTVTFDPQNHTVPEGSPANITVVLDKVPVSTCTVNVTTMDISATSPSDYERVVRQLVFQPGETRMTFSVDTLKDTLLEPSEHFKVVLTSNDENCVIGSPDESFVTIVDVTVDVVVKFNPDTYSVKEGVDGNAVIGLEVMGDHGFDFTVIVRAMDGSAIITEDYEDNMFSVTFPANVNEASFNITIVDDVIAECMENFTLKLEVPSEEAAKGVRLGSPDTAIVNIMDDDVAELMVGFEVADRMVKENVGTITIDIIATRAAAFEYSVTVNTVSNTAGSPGDYEAKEINVIFPVGSTRQSVDVVITDDNILEGMESFSLELSISDDLINKGMQVGPNAAAVINIMDNDIVVKFRRSSISVTEEEGVANVEVVAMGDLSMNFSIIVMAINGTAIQTLDFTGSMWPVNFPASVLGQTFPITIVSDDEVENAESFTLKIVVSNELSRRLTVGDPDIMTIVITDLKNDTVRGDPLFTIPLPSLYVEDNDLKGASLCFEYHGESGNYYNLISDQCVSINALFSAGVNDSSLNVITEMGIRTEGANGACHNITVRRAGCSAAFDGVPLVGMVNRDNVMVGMRRNYIRVSLPNCEKDKRLVVWMFCNKRNGEDMLEMVVSRGDGLQPTSHGLIGQFWNVPMGITPYIGSFGDGEVDKEDRVYEVTVSYPGSANRTFIAEYHPRSWIGKKPCLYAGNSMAGPMIEVPQFKDNVVDGAVDSYIVNSLYDPRFKHSKYESSCK